MWRLDIRIRIFYFLVAIFWLDIGRYGSPRYRLCWSRGYPRSVSPPLVMSTEMGGIVGVGDAITNHKEPLLEQQQQGTRHHNQQQEPHNQAQYQHQYPHHQQHQDQQLQHHNHQHHTHTPTPSSAYPLALSPTLYPLTHPPRIAHARHPLHDTRSSTPGIRPTRHRPADGHTTRHSGLLGAGCRQAMVGSRSVGGRELEARRLAGVGTQGVQRVCKAR